MLQVHHAASRPAKTKRRRWAQGVAGPSRYFLCSPRHPFTVKSNITMGPPAVLATSYPYGDVGCDRLGRHTSHNAAESKLACLLAPTPSVEWQQEIVLCPSSPSPPPLPSLPCVRRQLRDYFASSFVSKNNSHILVATSSGRIRIPLGLIVPEAIVIVLGLVLGWLKLARHFRQGSRSYPCSLQYRLFNTASLTPTSHSGIRQLARPRFWLALSPFRLDQASQQAEHRRPSPSHNITISQEHTVAAGSHAQAPLGSSLFRYNRSVRVPHPPSSQYDKISMC
ncbi:hypothetical protein B0I35DRAFT_34405 [Stachybotrys elegans]|uniref:Uncharacterized protein n=1 Tax=Stachybotrys elegans TaxID=80388 RepID=A0A8K0T467_9HYPO|nr:hypothetical protein B0I35DRAFT_34405 [Stachybotrys elegans]